MGIVPRFRMKHLQNTVTLKDVTVALCIEVLEPMVFKENEKVHKSLDIF